MLKTKLFKRTVVFSWYSNENYIKVTKPYYFGLVPFPFNYFYVKKLTKYHFDQLSWISSPDLQEEYVTAVSNTLHYSSNKILFYFRKC